MHSFSCHSWQIKIKLTYVGFRAHVKIASLIACILFFLFGVYCRISGSVLSPLLLSVLVKYYTMAAASVMVTSSRNTALILLDCQQSFIAGFWMAGVDVAEVQPLRSAFDRVATLLPKLSTDVRLLVTQCLFPTAYDFALYPPVSDALEARDPATIKRVIKPGNSILHARGATQWFDEFAASSADGVPTVVFGGCTLTSCVRVSATDLCERYAGSTSSSASSQRRLNVCVDLSLCAARASNYIRRCPSCLARYITSYGRSGEQCTCKSGVDLISPSDKAVMDMRAAGVNVYDSYDWSSFYITET